MSVCVLVIPVCTTNQELTFSQFVSSLSVYANYQLSASFTQPIRSRILSVSQFFVLASVISVKLCIPHLVIPWFKQEGCHLSFTFILLHDKKMTTSFQPSLSIIRKNSPSKFSFILYLKANACFLLIHFCIARMLKEYFMFIHFKALSLN